MSVGESKKSIMSNNYWERNDKCYGNHLSSFGSGIIFLSVSLLLAFFIGDALGYDCLDNMYPIGTNSTRLRTDCNSCVKAEAFEWRHRAHV